MKILTVLVMLFLIGCQTDDNHGYGYDYDFITPLGIEYRNDNNNEGIAPSKLDQIYIEVQECTQIYYYPSIMVVSNENIDRLGLYYENPDLIIIKKEYGLKHELIHYLLDKSKGYTDENDHNLEIFTSCAESPLDIFDWLYNIIDNISH